MQAALLSENELYSCYVLLEHTIFVHDTTTTIVVLHSQRDHENTKEQVAPGGAASAESESRENVQPHHEYVCGCPGFAALPGLTEFEGLRVACVLLCAGCVCVHTAHRELRRGQHSRVEDF